MDDWEREAMEREPPRQEFAAMRLQPLWFLLLRIRLGKIGRFKQIWKVVALKAKPAEANFVLMQFLESPAAFLDRYWCANALISLNQLDRAGWKPGDLSGRRSHDGLARVRVYLEGEALGAIPNEMPVPEGR
jgi:hypothetical protein